MSRIACVAAFGLAALASGAPIEMLPGVWVDSGLVEFDASVAMDCHHPETPDVYLEMMITGPDTREHESLLVSSIQPSNLHAGLLAAGFTHGNPVAFAEDNTRIPATGDPLIVEVRVGEDDAWVSLASWVETVNEGKSLTDDPSWSGLVFAGSQLLEDDEYAADREGALVSLTPFGFEVVSPVWIVSPEASVDEPVWIADRDRVPEFKTAVRVRVRAIEKPEESPTEDAPTTDLTD